MRKFVKVAFVAVFAASAGYGVYTSQKSEVMSDLALANVEALADSRESGGDCDGCIKSVIAICKDWGWGGCIGDPMYHPA